MVIKQKQNINSNDFIGKGWREMQKGHVYTYWACYAKRNHKLKNGTSYKGRDNIPVIG